MGKVSLSLLSGVLFACNGATDDNPMDVGGRDNDVFDPGDADIDVDTDSDADADADADSDADVDTKVIDPDNLLTNVGFERDNGSTPAQPNHWLVFPKGLTNFESQYTGDAIFNSTNTFAARTGTGGVKVFGLFTGSENETPLYQEFHDVVEGDSYTLSAWAITHSNDNLQGSSEAFVSIKFFDAGFNFFGSADSATVIDNSTPVDTWTELTVTGTVPAGATIIQAALEYFQCRDDMSGSCFDEGSVYFDDARFVLNP